MHNNKEKRTFLLSLTSDARSFIHHGEKEKALACYDKILAKYPEEYSAIYGKGMVFYEFGEIEKALELFDEVLEHNPDEIDTLYAKGAILRTMDEPEQAISFLDKVLKQNPDYYIATMAKGYALMDLNKLEESLACFEQLENTNLQEIVLNGKGHALRKLQKLQEARKHFEKAIKLDPYDWDALFGLGLIEYAEKNLKKAREFLSKSVIQEEENLEAWEVLEKIFIETEDFEREKAAKEKIKALKKA